MALAIHPDAAHARNAGPGLLPFLDAGAAVARVRVYAAPRRAAVTDAITSPMIVELPLLKPSATVVGGVMTLRPGAPALNLITATGNWASVINAAGDTVFDCDVSAPGGTGAIWLSTGGASGLLLYEGGETSISSGLLA